MRSNSASPNSVELIHVSEVVRIFRCSTKSAYNSCLIRRRRRGLYSDLTLRPAKQGLCPGLITVLRPSKLSRQGQKVPRVLA